MKPYQILIFFLSVILVLLFISLVFPQNGIKLSEELSLKFVSFENIFREDTVDYANISEIVGQPRIEAFSRKDTLITTSDPTPDSIPPPDTLMAEEAKLKTRGHNILFPDNKNDLFTPLFSTLANLSKEKKRVRILHYGDSQIEADRITGYIRHQMQMNFGGGGCGLVPAVPLYNGKRSISQSYSESWKRFTGFVNRDTSIHHKRYGALFSFSAIRRPMNIFTGNEWLEFEPSPIAYATARDFDHISLILAKSDSSAAKIRLDVNDSTMDEINVSLSFQYNKLNWELKETPRSIRFTFSPDESMMVYGVSLDKTWGVAVDNVPLRGSSGLMFSKADTSFLRQMYQDMNVGMLILQFGGNVVPYLNNFQQYESYFKRELRVIRKMLPYVPVLVVGPSDMSVKRNGKYITHPNLEGVRDAVKKAALDSGYAFWDMYEAMGGRNSMPSWVFAEPSLAVSDFVHFNARGARIIAEMLYDAIMHEYKKWKD
ncbi:MAG: hypothetical protein ACOCZL_02820 [Bacteroidota bacterium]